MPDAVRYACPDCGGYMLSKYGMADCYDCGVALEWDGEAGRWVNR